MDFTQPIVPQSENQRVPQPVRPFYHYFDIQTRFTDIDILGHVNNNAYLQMADLAKVRYFQAISGGSLSIMDIRAALVNIEVNFYEPTLFDDELRILTAITHIGNRSFTLEQRILSRETGSTKCILRSILAGFDPATQQGAPLDSELIRMVSEFEHNIF